jgi:hypothetical protein
MRFFTVAALILLGIGWSTYDARAQQTNSCKQCRDQERACKANYSAKTCKAEFDICMKSCGRK